MDDVRERLAAIEHERWAAWQSWMHAQCNQYGDGTLLIPAALVARWERQIATPYAELSEAERASDREQVDRSWPLIEELARKAAAWDRLLLVLRQHALWPSDEEPAGASDVAAPPLGSTAGREALAAVVAAARAIPAARVAALLGWPPVGYELCGSEARLVEALIAAGGLMTAEEARG